MELRLGHLLPFSAILPLSTSRQVHHALVTSSAQAAMHRRRPVPGDLQRSGTKLNSSLARHGDLQVGGTVDDQVSGEVEGHTLERAGERKPV